MATLLEDAVLRDAVVHDVCLMGCPSREALDRVGDKWSAMIVRTLSVGPHRFGELRRGIGGISQKMLTQTLRSLERDGLVRREAFATVPVTVEYALTPLGETLVGPIVAICDWAERHVGEVEAARARYERRG